MRRIGFGIAGALLAVVLSAAPVVAQGSIQVWSGKKGASPNPGPITGTDVSADVRALDVSVKGTATVTGSGTFATDPTDKDARVLGRVKIHDGTNSASVTAGGKLEVTCDNCGGSSFADSSAFTFGTTNILLNGYVVDDTATNAVTENSAGTPRMSPQRIPLAALYTAAGTALLGQTTMAGSIPVTLPTNPSTFPIDQQGRTFGGQAQQAVTATAAALGTQAAKHVCVQALLSNQIDVFLGSSSGVTTSNGYPLTPGSSWCENLTNANLVFVIAATTGASVAWTAAN